MIPVNISAIFSPGNDRNYTCKKTAKTSVKYCEKNIYGLELFIYLLKKAFKNEMKFF